LFEFRPLPRHRGAQPFVFVASGAELTFQALAVLRDQVEQVGVVKPMSLAAAVEAVSPPVDWASLTGKPQTFPPQTHPHAAADITSGTLEIARIPTGTTGTTVCLGNDSRLSDSRAPQSHAHGNITNAGAIGTASGVPIITGASGVLQAGSFGTTAGTFAAGNHAHTGYVTTTGGITAIAVVAAMPASPNANTLYIVTG
jgi:hypothetical protein